MLQEWDLIEPVKDGYCFRMELLRQWLTERKPLSRVQEEIDRIQPVADNLFQAAYNLYQGGQLEQATPLLRQAIGFNPNHLRANQLLAEILLAKGELIEARQLLESLYQYQPAAARPRLGQALLLQAKTIDKATVSKAKEIVYTSSVQRLLAERKVDLGSVAEGEISLKEKHIASPLSSSPKRRKTSAESTLVAKEDQLLTIYDQVLKLEPTQPEAVVGRQSIWKKRGDIALAGGNLKEALTAYRQANLSEKIRQVEEIVEVDVSNTYEQALAALRIGNEQTAQRLLGRIAMIEPGYKETTRYLHLAVTGMDIADQQETEASYQEAIRLMKQLQNELEVEKEARQKAEATNERAVNIRSQLEARIAELEDELNKDNKIIMNVIILVILISLLICAGLFWPLF